MTTMTLDEYQRLAKRTAVFPEGVALEYLTLGLVGEAGELANKVKKILRGDMNVEELEEGIKHELGDVLWYLSMLADHLNIDLGDLAEDNINMLFERKNKGTLKGSGDNR